MKQVLLVEDDDEGRSAMKEVLEERGFEVREATNGKGALELMLDAKEPALVILDLELPVMSGADLVDVMKRYHRLAKVPVLIVSGTKRERVPRHDKIVGVIQKPLDLPVLVQAVESCLGPGANQS